MFETRLCIIFLRVRPVGMVLLSESLTILVLMVMITVYSNVNQKKQLIMSAKTT